MTTPTSKVEAGDGSSNNKDSKEGAGDAKKGKSNFSKGPYRHASSVKFDGSCEDLKGHIFDCADVKQSDIFVETTKAIAIYVGAKYKYGADTSTAVETLEEQIIEVPPPCADVENPTLKRIWEKKIDEYVKRTTYIEENNKTLYSLVWGQCTDIMQQKVRSSEGFDVTMKTKNGVGLLTAIKNIAFSFEGQKYHPLSLLEAKKRFLNQVQGRTVTTQAYYEKFRNTMNVLKAIGADIGLDSGMRKILNGDRDLSTMTSDEKKSIDEEVVERFMAITLLMGADRTRYGRLLDNLENEFVAGHDNYPKTLTDAYNRLVYFTKSGEQNGLKGINGGEVAFVNAEGKHKEKPAKSEVECRRCKKKGHYASECDNERYIEGAEAKPKKHTGTTLLTDGVYDVDFLDDQPDYSEFQFINHDVTMNETAVTMQIGRDGRLPRTWILLDNQSTVDVFCNRELLSNIREHESTMDIHCNAGITSTKLIGELQGYGTVWYNPKGIANILSLSRVKERGYRVTFDSSDGNAFHLHKSDGGVRIFTQSNMGLY